MIVKLHTQRLQSLEEIRAFLAGTLPLDFDVPARSDAYGWIESSLRQLGYLRLGKADKGVVRDYLIKVSGFSRAQVTRLIAQYRPSGYVRDRRGLPANAFRRRYLPQDTVLLAELDTLHGTLCGPPPASSASGPITSSAIALPAPRLHLQRPALQPASVERLHAPAHPLDKTRPTPVNIGERRKPFPDGRPGFLRVDSVHQGDLDGIKGLYHINAVDEVTQMQVIVSVERISEHYLIPALDQLLEGFPFVILGFHSDNGSEYINKRVAKLLDKLRIDLTKSRARHSGDNALVESKNGSVVRKHLGYSHIPGRFAQRVNAFAVNVLSPYLNFHRPCLFPEEIVDAKGKRRKRYPYANLMTPYEKFKSLPDAAHYLKPGITFEHLDDIALQHSDNDAARLLNKARTELFRVINRAQQPAA